MTSQLKWFRLLFILGVFLLVASALDPMEGSIGIAIAGLLLAVSSYYRQDRHRKIFMFTMALIITGVFFLFYISSLGGFGGNSGRSWWWGVLILPYPLGWLINIVVLLVRAFKKAPEVVDTP